MFVNSLTFTINLNKNKNQDNLIIYILKYVLFGFVCLFGDFLILADFFIFFLKLILI